MKIIQALHDDLRKETIRGLKWKESFDMENFGELDKLTDKTFRPIDKQDEYGNHCGTACCIAGHVVAAATRLGMRMPTRDRLEAVRKWKPYLQDWRHHPETDVALHARALWARAYGEDEARRLEFDDRGWGCALEKTTPREAIAHLNGAPAVSHEY